MGENIRVRTLAAAVAMAVTLMSGVACSSSSSKASTTTTAVTKASYVALANGVCGSYRQVADANPPGNDPYNASYWNQQATAAQQEVAQLRALPSPSADASTLTSIYAQGDQAVAFVGRIASAAQAGNRDQVQALMAQANNANSPVAQFQGALVAYGVTGCAK